MALKGARIRYNF